MINAHEWIQFRLLAVHFFRRFFDNELLSPGADPYAVVVRALALLATPGMMISLYLMPRYVQLAYQDPQLIEAARRLDQMLFLTLAMSVMGFVTALEWEALFPDRTDYLILTPLPVRQRVAFLAKIASLMAFLLSFAVSINLMPAVLFPLVSRQNTVPGFLYSLWLIIHDITINGAILYAGSAFIFLAAMTIQGGLMTLLPERWFRVASAYARFLIMAAMVTFLLLYPRATQILKPSETLRILRWYPPAWFVALSDSWMGGRQLFPELAQRATLALVWAGGLAAIFYLIAYRRHVVQSLESMEGHASASLGGRIKVWIFERLLTGHPIELGVSLFTFDTLFRSRAHKLIFEAYMGVAAALVVWELVSLFAKRSYAVAFQPIPELLCVPLVLSFFLLSAMRFVYARPAELKANWLFRLSENKDSASGLEAAGKVMLLVGILPVTLPLLPLHAWLWGWPLAIIHCAYTAVMALMLRSVLLLNFRKIPFTCTFAPSGPGGVAWGTMYFFVFTLYAYSMAKAEQWMLRDSWRMVRIFAVLLAVLVAVEWVRRRLLTEDQHLLFEDAVAPEVRTLGLSH